MTLAEDLKSKLDAEEWTAFTIEGGYAVRPSGDRFVFDPPRQLKERRREDHRVTYAMFMFKDLSTMEYSYTESSGYKLTIGDQMYGYVCFYNQKRHELYATSLYAAKVEAVKFFKAPKSREHMVSVTLAEKYGEGVDHDGSELP